LRYVSRRLRIDDLTAFAVPEQPALSGDGRIVYVLRELDPEEDRPDRSLWLVAGGEPRRLTGGPADVAPAWSPDNSKIGFLRADDGPAQVWLLPSDGGEAEQLTTLDLGAGAPRWSPDGSKIAFAAPVDRGRGGAAPIVTTRLDYQADGAGYLREVRTHLFVLDVETKTCTQLTRGDWHASEPAWSPDGTKLAFTAATTPDADLRYRSPVWIVDASGGAPELAALADGSAVAVTWADDALLAVGWQGGPLGHLHLFRVSLDGGEATSLSAPLDRNVMPGGSGYPGGLPQIAGDGSVVFCARERGATHLYTVTGSGGAPRSILDGNERGVAALSVSGDTAAIVLVTSTSAGEIATVDLASGAVTVRTSHSIDAERYPQEEREFRISDGTVVHGWVIRDPNAKTPQPLLLDVHGGPHNAWNALADDWHLYHQELAGRGWAVLIVNPRGSDGYGEEFFNAALGAWGMADAKDFLEPIDQLIAEGLADPSKLAVTGYSYGGYMTCYLTSRDDRFAAAVAGGVVSDPISMAGTSDSGHHLAEIEMGGPWWESRSRYEEQSPLARVQDVDTPTLVYHGAADVRCPVGQAQQWFAALRERGVPTQLVLYPDASHLFVIDGKPSHRIDLGRRIVNFVEEHAGDQRVALDETHWQQRLDELAKKHGVPGAALGILRVRDGGDERVEVATGLTNIETGVEATADTVFQIGSMTKVWTATVAMQLVDEGKIELDAPIKDVLPELELSDAEANDKVTLRHLLTHTSGIDGDVFTDTGRGDDCLEKYVAELATAGQNHPLGATWSYCNSGFSLTGRVIEKLTDGTWDAAIQSRLVQPLGLAHTGTLPEEALLHRAAVGHIKSPEGETMRAPSAWGLPRTAGPAGLISSTVGDVLTWARVYLNGGRAEDGTQIISEETATLMTEHQAEVPDKYILGDSWGLGWIRFGWDGRRLVGHDGNTLGQAAFLRVLPDEGLAVTLLTNGGNTRDLYEDLYREVFAELAGLEMPHMPTPPTPPVEGDITPYLGAYERASVKLDVLERDGKPVLRTELTGPLAALVPETVEEYPMTAFADGLYLVREESAETWVPVTFYDLPTGEPYMHFGARATPKKL
jgi:dipeptidyl aminopeptidase/acylaminoacyl peptidase